MAYQLTQDAHSCGPETLATQDFGEIARLFYGEDLRSQTLSQLPTVQPRRSSAGTKPSAPGLAHLPHHPVGEFCRAAVLAPPLPALHVY